MEIKLREVLQREFKARGLSINEAARKCKIPISTLHGWTKGNSLPTAKNLHFIKTLSDYLEISITMLLFNVHDKDSSNTVLFSSNFVDEGHRYKITVEKMKK